MIEDVKFNIFNFINLFLINIRKIFLILIICFSVSIYIYNTQKTTYTSIAKIQSLELIQNSLDNVGYDGNELLKLFNFSFYNKEIIQKTLDEVLKSQNIVILSNDDMLDKIDIETSEAGLIVTINSESEVFNSNFISIMALYKI